MRRSSGAARTSLLLAAILVVAAPAPASATDCSGAVFARHPDRPAVLGRVVTVSWTSTPCPDPDGFECALGGGTAAEIADLTIEVLERWGEGGAPVPHEPGTLRLVGPHAHTSECGPPPLGEGTVLVFVLGAPVDGGFQLEDSFPLAEPEREPAPPVRKGSGCAGCATGDPGAGLALIALIVGWMVSRARRRRLT